MSTAKVLTEYAHALKEVDVVEDDAVPSASRGEEIVSTVSTSYDMSASTSGRGDLWNWGMYDEDVEREIDARVPNFATFDTDGFSEQLYYRALRQLPVSLDDHADRTILEVGCGLGEGLNLLSRVVSASGLVGLDLSEMAIERANARLSRGSALRFVQGDAERLPFVESYRHHVARKV